MDDRRQSDAVADVIRWVESVVIGLHLCPFARAALPATRVIAVPPGARALDVVLDEAAHLDTERVTATTLVVVPEGLADFEDYLDALAEIEGLLSAAGYDGILQIASFHPDYVFADAEPDDPANGTNRSPWPVFHLLREADVSAAVDRHPDPAGIPARNQELLRRRAALSRRG
jgi:uncharacterized protein